MVFQRLSSVTTRLKKLALALQIKLTVCGILYALTLTWLSAPDLAYDSGQYFSYGKNLVQTHVYGQHAGVPDMHREPGYGFFLASIFFVVQKIFGDLKSVNEFFLLKTVVFWQSLLFFFSFYYFAFFVGLPKKIALIFFLFCIFSPTLSGTNTVIYSETLALSLMALFFFVYVQALKKCNFRLCILAGLIWGALVLTKGYLEYFTCVFGGLSFFYFLYKRRPSKLAVAFLCITLSAFLCIQLWNIRNKTQLGPQMGSLRLSSAITGKIYRVARFQLPKDIPKALIASVGTNLCMLIYSEQECLKFEMRGSDSIGISMFHEYTKKLGSSKKAQEALLRDSFWKYWENPGLQIFGSILEVIRISFFEAPQRFNTGVQLIDLFPKVWHFAGSLLIWFLFFIGLGQLLKSNGFRANPVLFFTALGILFYHYLFMSQVTNLVRYVYPVIPFIYLFACLGAWGVVMGKKANTL